MFDMHCTNSFSLCGRTLVPAYVLWMMDRSGINWNINDKELKLWEAMHYICIQDTTTTNFRNSEQSFEISLWDIGRWLSSPFCFVLFVANYVNMQCKTMRTELMIDFTTNLICTQSHLGLGGWGLGGGGDGLQQVVWNNLIFRYTQVESGVCVSICIERQSKDACTCNWFVFLLRVFLNIQDLCIKQRGSYSH